MALSNTLTSLNPLDFITVTK